MRWIVGITGGIAAYKTPELVRLLKKQGAEVRVVMSQGAQAFVTPLTLQAVSQQPVHTELLDPHAEAAMGHIELARWAEGIIIAPLSANRLATLALGMADDLLSTLCLATESPLFVAPAMNQKMWHHPATQQHIQTLRTRGVSILGPAEGEQACGEYGLGRMLEPEAIVQALMPSRLFEGVSMVITAGPTREFIDPIRFISNRSSGKMGFALASVAASMGAKVDLIAGPVHLPTPHGVARFDVQSAEEMAAVVQEKMLQADIFIGTAAVTDFRPEHTATQKIKKNEHPWPSTWINTPDIIAMTAKQYPQKLVVGFAAETENGEEHAKQKLKNKQIDLIALNDVSRHDIGFESDDNALTILSQDKTYSIAKASKRQVATDLLRIMREYYDAKN